MSYAKNFPDMDKTDRLLEALDHPELFSDSEIEDILADAEAREVYDMLVKTKRGLRSEPVPDVESEWKEFERINMLHRSPSKGIFSRKIAASVAIGLVSLAAVAAAVDYFIIREAAASFPETVDVKDATNVSYTDTLAKADGGQITDMPTTIIFDNESLESVVRQLAHHYGYEPVFSADAPKGLRLYFRWDRTQPVEKVITDLNRFERINISITGTTIKID